MSEKEENSITLENGLCDSCENPTDTLFPVAVLDELPTGGMKHVQKWYCVACKGELELEAEEKDAGGEDESSAWDASSNTFWPKKSFIHR